MSKKIDRAMHGPSWAEVILGAVLSAVLGVVLGAALLVLREPVKKMPKEPVRGAVYYIEGSKDPGKARQTLAKRKAFVEGQSIVVTEDEMNSLVAAPAPGTPGAPGPKGAQKGKEKAAPPADASETLALGAPNFRIADGKLQVGVPVTINAMDLGHQVIVQARGGFVKKGDMFVYEPDEIYFGSCPVQRLPFVSNYVREKVLAEQSLPEDIKASWKRLASVEIQGKTVKLTMP